MTDNKGYVYILTSFKNGRFYIGSTGDIDKRLKDHNSGKVKATRNFKPLVLVFLQVYDNITHARKIEHKIKKLKRRDYIEKIIKERVIRLGQ
jgi:putative endonuclease